MAKYSYPAIFHTDKETGGYWIEFPDWCKAHIGAYTDGRNYAQARYMAEDLLGMLCYYQELDKKEMPPVKKLQDYFEISHISNNFVEIIEVDTEKYGKMMAHCRKDKRRWIMEERARRRYLYPHMHMASSPSC